MGWFTFDQQHMVTSIRKRFIAHGLLIGFVVSIYMAFLYAAGIQYLASWWIPNLKFFILIGMICYAITRLRETYTWQPFDLKSTFVIFFSMALIASLVYTVWDIILFNIIDKNLANEWSDYFISNINNLMRKSGYPEGTIMARLKEMKDLPSQFKPLAQLKSWLSGGIFLAIMSLIFASFLKRKTPSNPFQA